MKKKVYLLVFEGLADWEPALAMCEINRSGLFEVVSVGFNRKTIRSMGGLWISPQVSLDEVRPAETAMLVLPGGEMWEKDGNPELEDFLRDLFKKDIPLAAACGGTLEFARAGLLETAYHTSNSLEYLKGFVPDYHGEPFYREQLAARDKNLITASGLGCVEFAREIILQLGIYSLEDTKEWFEMFKKGVYPG